MSMKSFSKKIHAFEASIKDLSKIANYLDVKYNIKLKKYASDAVYETENYLQKLDPLDKKTFRDFREELNREMTEKYPDLEGLGNQLAEFQQLGVKFSLIAIKRQDQSLVDLLNGNTIPPTLAKEANLLAAKAEYLFAMYEQLDRHLNKYIKTGYTDVPLSEMIYKFYHDYKLPFDEKSLEKYKESLQYFTDLNARIKELAANYR